MTSHANFVSRLYNEVEEEIEVIAPPKNNHIRPVRKIIVEKNRWRGMVQHINQHAGYGFISINRDSIPPVDDMTETEAQAYNVQNGLFFSFTELKLDHRISVQAQVEFYIRPHIRGPRATDIYIIDYDSGE